MITIVLAILTVACVLLTVMFLATLRGIVELRLRLAGHTTSSQGFIDAGSALPAALLSTLPDANDIALIVFVSEGCDACVELTSILPTIPVTTVACVLGNDTGDIRGRFAKTVIFADGAVTAAVARELKISASPVVILQQAGRVVGSAYGVSTETAEDMHLWWNHAQQLLKEKVT